MRCIVTSEGGQAPWTYTIQHGTVIDGTGAARFTADVLIREGRIAEVALHLPP
jgi:N-acyl-D-aspartate/D-glutamate deacylase